MDAIMKRRSTRKFQERPVEDGKIERILRAAMQSPTGHNAQDWEFIVIRDPATREAVSKMSEFTVCAKKAPLVIIVAANMDRAVKHEPLWICDMAAACQTILIAVEEEGLGACWLASYPHPGRVQYLKELFALPESIEPYAVIAIGYKQYEKPFDDRFDESKIHWERF